MIDETQAPGCFGSALTYDEGSAECSQCMFAGQCGPKSAERMKYLREVLQLPEPKPSRAKAKVVPVGATEFTVPKKVQAWLDRFEQRGVKVTEMLRMGQNPFPESPLFLRIACILLLHFRDAGVEQNTLVDAYMRKLSWTKGTAAAHATQARQILDQLGAISYENGRMRLK